MRSSPPPYCLGNRIRARRRSTPLCYCDLCQKLLAASYCTFYVCNSAVPSLWQAWAKSPLRLLHLVPSASKSLGLLQDQLFASKIGHDIFSAAGSLAGAPTAQQAKPPILPGSLAPCLAGCIADSQRAAGRAPSPARWSSISCKRSTRSPIRMTLPRHPTLLAVSLVVMHFWRAKDSEPCQNRSLNLGHLFL